MKDRYNYLQQRESPLSEALMSLIIGLTLMSWLLVIRASWEFVRISVVSQYFPLVLILIHFVIRRKIVDLFPCFIATVTTSISFYLIMVLIPFTGHGKSVTNMIYLGAIVFAFTVFSVHYRLKPVIKAGDSNLLLFSAISLPPFGIYYFFTMRSDLFNLFIWNAVASAVLYLFLRQFATFDSKYYHSISKSSVPVNQLKKQNYMTGIYLALIFLFLFIILTIVPILIYSDVLSQLLRTIIPAIISAIFIFFNFLGSILLGEDNPIEAEDNNYLREQAEDAPWVLVLAYYMAIAILIIAIHMIPKAIRMIIQSAPKYHKATSTTDDGLIVDTIEDINPDKKVRKAKHRYFGEGYERKIRKKFYNKTRHAMDDGLPISSASTPGQIETVLLTEGDSEISKLRTEYEHVRYSK